MPKVKNRNSGKIYWIFLELQSENKSRLGPFLLTLTTISYVTVKLKRVIYLRCNLFAKDTTLSC